MPTEIITRTITVKEEVSLPPTNLPDNDGMPLESPWHRKNINLLIESVDVHRRGRRDYFAGGNMFIYFSAQQVRNRDYRGPDFFVVNGVDRDRPRLSWEVWNEDGQYPNVIVELLSPTTAVEDRTTKKDVYERTFRLPEYFLYDPDERRLEGWRLAPGGAYVAITPDERGWMWSEQLQLWLGTWPGVYQGQEDLWLRLYGPDGQLVPTQAEAERHRAEAEHHRAEAERHRAEAAEAETQRLRQELDELRRRLTPPPESAE
jgi:Uma2 family endonuclease